MELTISQQFAYDTIINNLNIVNIILLEGMGGTGKTTLTKLIAKHFLKSYTSVCAIAPTHKAKNVISNILNEKSIIKIPAFTIASILGKIKEHSYIGSKKFSDPNIKKFNSYTLFIIDEVSMIENKDMNIIINYIKINNKMLLLIGDKYQIPSPSSRLINIDEILQKEQSIVFSNEDILKLELTDIVRQKEGSDIINLCLYTRNHIFTDFHIKDSEYSHIIPYGEIYECFITLFRENTNCKLITYTNESVKTHNIEIRKKLGYTSPYVLNDILMAYTSIGYPELILENGQDYSIIKLYRTDNHTINSWCRLAGYIIDLKVIGNDAIIKNLFFIDVLDDNNYCFIKELIDRGTKVNLQKSTPKDYQYYKSLKDKAIFLEDIYFFSNEIYSETTFKENHPLLFTNIHEIINFETKTIVKINSKLSEKIESLYSNIIDTRIEDSKLISNSEKLADRFKVIEKDIYWSYCTNSHKSQASTYSGVVIDENDFSKLKNKWNYKYGKLENNILEKNQLRYVAYSRAKDNLYIACDDI